MSHRAARRMPPRYIFLILLAMLLGILAAAEPGCRSAGVAGDITIVLDCGATMARPGVSGEPFRGVVDRCAKMLGPVDGRVSIIAEPGQRVESSGADWVAAAKRISPTAIRSSIDQAVADRLRQTRGWVIVLSDQHLSISDSRILQIVPEVPAPAVAINLLAARVQPRPQVMIRLENHSDRKSIQLRISSGANTINRQIQLAGKSQDEFFNLPAVDQIVTVEVDPHLPLDPWDKAYLVRRSPGIRLALTGDVPAAVRRMAAVYSRDRSPNARATDVFISDRPLDDSQAGVWIDQTSGEDVHGTANATRHQITRNITGWPDTGKRESMPTGYSAVVSIGGAAIVGFREVPVRQVWIRADLKDWVKTVDFVSFFGNVFDWIAQADQQEMSTGPAMLGNGWESVEPSDRPPGVAAGAWPGIYRSDAGGLIAVNAGEYPADFSAVDTGVGRLPMARPATMTSLLPEMIFCSLACVLLAMFFWPTGRVVI